MSGRVVLVGGGVRCGKSAFALALARKRGTRRTFIATGEAGDDEMHQRIARHVAERGDDFATIEEPLALCEAFERASAKPGTEVVVIDSLALWIANLLLRATPVVQIQHDIDALIAAIARRTVETIVVTSEVGMGLVSEHTLGRAFVDLTGAVHQRAAAHADEVYFGALGAILRLRPAPVALVDAEGVA